MFRGNILCPSVTIKRSGQLHFLHRQTEGDTGLFFFFFDAMFQCPVGPLQPKPSIEPLIVSFLDRRIKPFSRVLCVQVKPHEIKGRKRQFTTPILSWCTS